MVKSVIGEKMGKWLREMEDQQKAESIRRATPYDMYNLALAEGVISDEEYQEAEIQYRQRDTWFYTGD